MYYLYEIKIKNNDFNCHKTYASSTFKKVLRHYQNIIKYSLNYEPLILFSKPQHAKKQIKEYFETENPQRAWVILESENNDKTKRIKQY